MASTSKKRRVPGGLFITFEGPEGAGKSTQVKLLADALDARGFDICLTREPGGTPLAEALRGIVMDSSDSEPGGICDETELLLFAASRAQLVRRVILPALAAGTIVICDRFADSTTVYQGFARGLSMDFIRKVHAFCVGPRWPDLTFLLDIEVESGFLRKRLDPATGQEDRIEREKHEFHQRVREGFLQLARQESERIRILPGNRSAQAIHGQILEIVEHALV